jgi:hypothetical protein
LTTVYPCPWYSAIPSIINNTVPIYPPPTIPYPSITHIYPSVTKENIADEQFEEKEVRRMPVSETPELNRS